MRIIYEKRKGQFHGNCPSLEEFSYENVSSMVYTINGKCGESVS